MNIKTVILAGSGHAHLEVIKTLTKKEISIHRFILISPHKQTYYSGLIPRLIADDIDISMLTIESAAFAKSKGFQYIQDSIQSVDSINNSVHLLSGKKINFDILSLNIGGVATDIPTQSPESTVQLRPIDKFLNQWQSIQKNDLKSKNLRFVVVGGGAAAVEVAVALRIKNKYEVHLVTHGSRLCENYPKKTSASIEKSLLKLNIQIHYNEYVGEVFSKYIKLKNGSIIPFEFIFMATPTKQNEIIKSPTNSKLQHSSRIFSVGDGATLTHHPELPRSGVIAVHQGQHLARSIKNLLTDQPISKFKIPSNQLNILITGQNSAHLVWGHFCIYAKWVYQLKKWIDNRYMIQFIL